MGLCTSTSGSTAAKSHTSSGQGVSISSAGLEPRILTAANQASSVVASNEAEPRRVRWSGRSGRSGGGRER